MIARLILCAVALLPCFAGAALARPERVVSINLCADELLLALADPQQITALSVYATDPAMSFAAKDAESYRHDIADAEQVVELAPDLVLAGRFTKRATREMLERLGYRVELLDAVRSVDDSVAQIRRIAALLGHPERGERLVAEIYAARNRVSIDAQAQRPTAAVYQRRGYVSGGETLTAELLALAGFADGAEPLVGTRGGFVSLEALVANPPDFIVVAAADRPAEDQGTALLAHPALTDIFPPARRIVLPERYTVCGGPSLPAAIDYLAREALRVTSGT